MPSAASYSLRSRMRCKELIVAPLREQIWAAMDAEGKVYDELMGGPDNMEAVNVFLQRREPNFSTRV